MRKIIAAIAEVYRGIYNALGMFLSVFGILASIAIVIFASRATMLSEVFLAILGLAVLAPVAIGLARSFSGEDAIAPPETVRDFHAVSYAATSDADMRELTRFALAKFGETFPAEVDTGAVRNGSALGLRLTNDQGRNIGFLDVYHFRDDVLALWRQGQIEETKMTLDQFVPIPQRPVPSLDLVLGALYIDTANPVATYHLAHGLIETAKDYLNSALKDISSVNIYATIFNKQAGARWARREGFVLDIRGDKRGAAGGGHDVFVLNFKPTGSTPRGSFSVYGNDVEYRIKLRLK